MSAKIIPIGLKRPVCGTCGGGNITAASTVNWNLVLQRFEPANPVEQVYCSRCEQLDTPEWIPVPVLRLDVTVYLHYALQGCYCATGENADEVSVWVESAGTGSHGGDEELESYSFAIGGKVSWQEATESADRVARELADKYDTEIQRY